MTIIFHRTFEKQLHKLAMGERERFRERLKIFLADPFSARLNNHPLKGKYVNYRSINIGGDLRAVFKFMDDDECIFTKIGTHSELYS
jgi:mRNA interferase YafQ